MEVITKYLKQVMQLQRNLFPASFYRGTKKNNITSLKKVTKY